MRANLHLRAASKPKSYDEEAHTIEVEVSTENPVHGVSLSHKRGAVDLSRFIGAPFLNAHKRGDVRDVLGKIVAARIEERTLIATVKLTRRADAAGIVQDIIDGMIPQTSVGFTVSAWGQDSVDPKTGARTRTATRWRPFEVSAVPYAADETRVRSEDANPGETNRSHPMKVKKTAGVNPASGPFTREQVEQAYRYIEEHNPAPGSELPPHVFDPIKWNVDQMDAAQTRAEIRGIAKRAGLPAEWADAQIDSDATPEEARAAAFDAMQERSSSAPRTRVLNPGPSPEQELHLRAEGFAARYLGVPLKNDAAKPFANLSVEDQARDWLEANGIRTRGMSREALLTTAFQTRSGQHTTSDFPLMLDVGLGSAVRAAYAVALSPAVAIFCQKVTANDFRTQNVHQLGELPKLQKVGESGEIKSITRGEAREGWALDTYGGIFGASRKLIVNDAYNQLADFARDAGQASAATVADLVVSTLTQSAGAGPTMGDTKAMFHADHGNLFTDAGLAAIDETGISAMRVAMLTQTGVDGVTIIDVRPDTIIVAPSRLTEAEKFVATINATRTEDAQPIKLSVVCEPRLEAVNPFGFYLADSRNPALYLGGLAGAEGPQVSARDGWEVLGREWRVTLDVGVGARDFRGVAFNAGEDSNTALA